MKKQLFTLLVLFTGFFAWAQNDTNSKRLQPLTKFDLGLQGLGFGFERRLGTTSTIELSAGLGGAYEVASRSLTYILPGGAVYVSLHPRFYYNRQKRIVKAKNNALNAGNYVGVRIKYVSKSISENVFSNDAMLFNVHWGLQRAVGKRWILNALIGPGYAIDVTDLNHAPGTFYPAVDLKFSYILNKRYN